MKNRTQKSSFVVLKLGSSTLTEAGDPNHALIARLCEEICALGTLGYRPVVVTSGAVQLGHAAADIGDVTMTRKARAAFGQVRLMAAFAEHLSRFGYPAAQVLLKYDDFVSQGTRADLAATIGSILSSNGIVLINENDVTSAAGGFPSNDELGAALVGLLGASKLIIFTDRPGVYDADPRTHRSARLLDTIGAFDERLARAATDIPTSTGTGGMKSKVLAAQAAAVHGATTVVACYDKPGKLLRIVQGERVGTWLVPDREIDIKTRIRKPQPQEECPV